jgi:SAM-dependent methyltransferase
MAQDAVSIGSWEDAIEAADTPDYIARNKAMWERWAPMHLAASHKAWAREELRWGMWNVGEEQLQLLSGLPARADVVELGCGAGATLAWLARREYRPVGVDIARPFLEAAARFQEEFGDWFPLLCANAEQLHFDIESFDCVISEYGASLWCSPRRWLPEAARLLRVGGRLIFFTNSAHLMSCTPDDGTVGQQLVRNYFSTYRVEFSDDEGVEFHPTYAHWVGLLRKSGFVLDELIEPRPPTTDATPRYPLASAEWAQRWPTEEIWVATKVS